MSDELAIGALQAARARGLVVPRDLSVVGWDDTPEARRADPPLTTIRQSLRDQGRRCAELAAAGGAARARVEPQPWESVVRASQPDNRRFRRPCVLRLAWAAPASADIELGARVSGHPAAPRGITAGACGTVVGQAGWIQRRWRVRFDDGTVHRRAGVRARPPPRHGPLPPLRYLNRT